MTDRTHPDDLAEKIRTLCEENGAALSSVRFLTDAGEHRYGAIHQYRMGNAVPDARLTPTAAGQEA